jgi:hypothetical protein
MKKRDFFLAACKAEEYRRAAWVTSAFAIVQEDPEAWKKDAYAYRIVQTPAGHFFVDPADLTQLIKIEDAKAGAPIFDRKEAVELKKGDLPNLHEDCTSKYGILLTNWTLLVYAFGTKLAFINGEIQANKIEEQIAHRLKNTPKEGEARDDKFIYVDEYLRFANGAFYLADFANLFVPAGSKKVMTVSPDIVKLRAKLINENKDRLHDPAVVAAIDAELVKADKEWLKGDDAEHFLLSGKSYNIIRKKLFLQMGAEMGLDESQSVDYIPRSLAEGWDISKFPAMNNTLRAGSFNRGAQTMLGGESVKWLLRASSNMAVTADDCGSKLGNIVAVEDKKKWVGFSLVSEKGPIKLTDENIGTYMGKQVMVRSPMFCKLPKTDFCKVCVGDRLATNPTALSAAIAKYGSDFMLIFMAAAHAKALLLNTMDYRKVII